MLWQPPRELTEFYVRNATLGQSKRYRLAALAEKYHLGLQYEGLKDWYADAPMRERRPKILIPLFAEAVRDMGSFVWGGEKFPVARVVSTIDPNDPPDADEIGPLVDADTAGMLSSFLAKMVEAGELDRMAREFTDRALVSSSAGIVIGCQAGFLSWQVYAGKDCTPTWSKSHPRRLERMEIVYRYPKEEPSPWGSYGKPVEYWYRRVIDEQRDVTYVEVPVKNGQMQPEWQEDPEKTVEHGLGWCPAHWVRTFPDSMDPIDGRMLVDPQLYPLLDDVNYIASQRSRAAAYSADPQLLRYGVPESQRENLAKSPGRVWDFPIEAKLDALELSGKGPEIATAHLEDFAQRFREAIGVVKSDPKTTAGNLSGVVLEFLHRPMISLAGTLRHDLGSRGYEAVLNMAMRLCADMVERGLTVWVPGVNRAARIIRSVQRGPVWLDFDLTLDWPPYFPLTQEEQAARVQTAMTANGAGLWSKRTAVQYVAAVGNIKDADAEIAAIDGDQAKAQEQAMAQQMAMQGFGAPEGGEPVPAEDAPPAVPAEPIDAGEPASE